MGGGSWCKNFQRGFTHFVFLLFLFFQNFSWGVVPCFTYTPVILRLSQQSSLMAQERIRSVVIGCHIDNDLISKKPWDQSDLQKFSQKMMISSQMPKFLKTWEFEPTYKNVPSKFECKYYGLAQRRTQKNTFFDKFVYGNEAKSKIRVPPGSYFYIQRTLSTNVSTYICRITLLFFVKMLIKKL